MRSTWCRRAFSTAGLAVLLLCGRAWSQPAEEVVERGPQGAINWSLGLLQAKGVVTPRKPLSQEPAERESALAEARREAGQNLFETVMKVRIGRKRHVRDLTGDDIIAAKIREMVETARVVKQEYLSDGTVAVTVEMSLFGGFSQLVLPPEIKQVESLKTLGETPAGLPPGPAGTPDSRRVKEPAAYTGLVVDARGSGSLPAIYPTVFDETGEEIYGAAYVSREFVVQHGMSGYTRDPGAALADPRVTPRPLTVKGLRPFEDDPSSIVISNADGARIRSTPEHLSFFKTCNVVIVLDPPAETPAGEPGTPAD